MCRGAQGHAGSAQQSQDPCYNPTIYQLRSVVGGTYPPDLNMWGRFHRAWRTKFLSAQTRPGFWALLLTTGGPQRRDQVGKIRSVMETRPSALEYQLAVPDPGRWFGGNGTREP